MADLHTPKPHSHNTDIETPYPDHDHQNFITETSSPAQMSESSREVEPFYCARLGKSRKLCGLQQYPYPPCQWLVGPDWMCMLLTYGLIIVPFAFFAIYILTDMPRGYAVFPSLMAALTLCFYSLCACGDPGIVRKTERIAANQIAATVCSICEIPRPYTASHCYECGVCIDELDHHCPWIGKCVGKKTIKFFYCFSGSIVALFVYMIALVAYYLVQKD